MKVVAMFRVSTDRQAEQGASLDAQERQFRSTAKAQGWRVVAEFRGSESASIAGSERQVLQQVLACIREHRPDAVYVHEQSRLTRGDELEVAMLLRELRERRMKIIIGGVVRDLASIDERFMVGIQSLVDRAESDRIRERVNRGKRERALQGKKNTGRAPYGYMNPPLGHPQRGTLQIVPDKARVVRRIFEMSAAGVGMDRIAETLQAEGVPTAQGGLWYETTIRQILRNPAYIGTHCSGVWKVKPGTRSQKRDFDDTNAVIVPNAHEAIIPKELWDRVQDRSMPPHASPRLLSGLLTLNGEKASTAINKEFNGYYVRGKHGFPWVMAKDMEAAVWVSLSRILTQPEIIDACLNSGGGDGSTALAERRTDLQAQISKVQARLGRLTEMRADGELTREEFQQRASEARATLQTLEKSLQAVESELETVNPDRIRQALAVARIALAPAERLSKTEQRRFLISIVRRVHANVLRRKEPIPRDGQGRLYKGGGFVNWQITDLRFELGFPVWNPSTQSHTASRCCTTSPPATTATPTRTARAK